MAAEQKEEIAEIFALAPLPSTKRGYSFHVYTASKGPYAGWMAYGHGRFVVLRNMEDPRQCKIFSEHVDRVNVACFSPNGEWVASGDESGKVIVWSTLNWNTKNTVQACQNVLDIDWSPDGKRIVAVGDGKQVCAKVFTWDSGNNLGHIDAHQQPILTCHYRQERPYFIVTGSEDLSLQWYKGPPFKFDHSFKEFDRYPNRARWNPSCDTLVSVSSCGRISVFDGKTGEFQRLIQDKVNGHKGAIYHFSWAPDGKTFVTASSDRTAKLWDLESGSVLGTFPVSEKPGIPDMQQSTLWTPQGKLASFSLSGAINWLDADKASSADPLPLPVCVWQGHKAPVSGLVLNAARQEIYTADSDGQLVAWDFQTGLGSWFQGGGHEGKGIRALALSADAKYVITAGADDKVRWASTETRSWNEGHVAEVGGLPVFVAAANQDASLAVVGLAQDKLVVLRNGQVASSLSLDYSSLELSFSPDDQFLAVAGKDGRVRKYKFNASENVLELVGKFDEDKHAKSAAGVTWSPDGKLIVSTAKDASIHLRDAETGKLLNITEWAFHSATVNGARFSPNGKRLVTCSEDESVIVWKDLSNYKHERDTVSQAHKGGVQHAQFWDDQTLVTVGGDNVIRTWSYPHNE